jgi:hypothetical protein
MWKRETRKRDGYRKSHTEPEEINLEETAMIEIYVERMILGKCEGKYKYVNQYTQRAIFISVC